MTSIRPSTHRADVEKPVQDLKQAFQAALRNDGLFNNEGAEARDRFDRSAGTFHSARSWVDSAIREQDGRTYPFPIGLEPAGGAEPAVMPAPGMPRPIPEPPILPGPLPTPGNGAKNHLTTTLYAIAAQLDTDIKSLKDAVDDAGAKVQPHEKQRVDAYIDSVFASIDILANAIAKRADLAKDSRSPSEIFNDIKRSVNDRRNDETRAGPLGLLTRFEAREADDFMSQLKMMRGQGRISDDTLNDVVQVFYDTAVSPYGDLVLSQDAVDLIKQRGFGPNLDWDAAVEAYKEEHPIVALYSATINDIVEGGGNGMSVNELESVLRAGTAAYNELSVDFVRNGPTAFGSAALSGPNADAASMSRGERAQHVQELGQSLKALSSVVDQLRAQG